MSLNNRLKNIIKKLDYSSIKEITVENCLNKNLFKNKANLIELALNMISQMIDEPAESVIKRVLSEKHFNNWRVLLKYLFDCELKEKIKNAENFNENLHED